MQIALVRLLDLALYPDTRFFHVPNGGYRTKAEGAIFKKMGVRKGMPDFVFIRRATIDNTTVAVAYGIELKADDGELSDDQVACHAWLSPTGMPIAVARSIDEVFEHLDAWSIPHRAPSITANAQRG